MNSSNEDVMPLKLVIIEKFKEEIRKSLLRRDLKINEKRVLRVGISHLNLLNYVIASDLLTFFTVTIKKSCILNYLILNNSLRYPSYPE